eukprot:Colp12_sorted_trinity150504_noHs@12953
MKAVVYSRAANNGVKLINKPTTTLDDQGPSGFKSFFVSAFITFGSAFLSLMRFFFKSVPLPYGYNPQRKFVLCRVHSVGLNPVDAKWLYGDKLPEFCTPFLKRLLQGRTIGIDFSGTVIEAPEGCGFSVGDEVFGTVPPPTGSLAECIKVPTDFISHKPKNLTFDEASAIPLVGLTVWQAFTDHHLQWGHKVLVIGASGGTGHVAVQIAKSKGARVTAICGSRNVSFVKSLNADHIICYDKDDIIASLAQIVSDHGAFDFVFDTVTSDDQRDKASDYKHRIKSATNPALLSGSAMYITIGADPEGWVKAHARRFLGLNLFPKGEILHWVRFPCAQAELAQLAHLCESGQLKVQIGKKVDFEEKEIQEACGLLKSRRTVGKVVISLIK